MEDQQFPIEKFPNPEARRVYEKYGRELPSPHPDLKVTTVVPTLAELDSGNFWRLLRSLGTQYEVDYNSFEVIFVVNNSRDGLDSFERYGAQTLNGQRYEENQRHLQIIHALIQRTDEARFGDRNADKHLEKDLEDFNLTEWEIATAKLIVRKGVHLMAIDASSQDKCLVLSAGDNPIAISRNIGGWITEHRHNLINQDGYLDYLDGDCYLPKSYYRDLINVFNMGQYEVVYKPLDLNSPDIPVFVENQPKRIDRVFSLMRYLMSSRVKKDYYVMSKQAMDPQSYFRVGGPSMCLSVSHFVKIKGYPNSQFDADFDFSSNAFINTHLQNVFFFETPVYLSDRGREGSIDGHSRGIVFDKPTNTHSIFDKLSNSRLDGVVPVISGIIYAEKNLWDYINIQLKMHPSVLGDLQDLQDEYEEIKKSVYKDYLIKRKVANKNIQGIVDRLAQSDIDRDIPYWEIDTLIEILNLGPRYTDFLQKNPTIVEALVFLWDYVVEKSEDQGEVLSREDLATKIYDLGVSLIPEIFQEPSDIMPRLPKDARFLQNSALNLSDYIFYNKVIYLMQARVMNRLSQGSSSNK